MKITDIRMTPNDHPAGCIPSNGGGWVTVYGLDGRAAVARIHITKATVAMARELADLLRWTADRIEAGEEAPTNVISIGPLDADAFLGEGRR